MDLDGVRERCTHLVSSTPDATSALSLVCSTLRTGVEHYDWVGFYVVVPGARELKLGPFDGDPTEHVRISFGEGICGQAADTKTTFLIQDVSEESNYLSCSPKVKSELVVPVFHRSELVGEIDIDSHVRNAFSERDEELLDYLASLTGPLVAEIARNL